MKNWWGVELTSKSLESLYEVFDPLQEVKHSLRTYVCFHCSLTQESVFQMRHGDPEVEYTRR
jgi:hypothetical protein